MNERSARPRSTLIAAAAALFTILAAAGGSATADKPRPTDPFREEHVEIREHLEHLSTAVGELPRASKKQRAAKMAFVTKFLREHIVAHAEAEERALYPAVDRAVGCPDAHPFTATMRREHTIVGRWIADLEALAKKDDATAFARKADRLLGLIEAHFEEEEEVLLPILDATMTPEQFKRIVDQM